MAVQRSWWTTEAIIAPIYVARSMLMNSCGPLRSSIMMDHVEKGSRGKWNALDSVRKFGWSGSAFIGGILVADYGYGWTFFLTAGIQFLGTCFWVALLPVVE